MATFTPNVRVIVNGEPVDASTTNGPISDLTQRTNWLKAQLEALEAGSQLLLRAQSVSSGTLEGTPVYINTATDVFEPALTAIDETNLNLAGDTTYWQGMAVNVSGTSADIVLGGSVTLPTATWSSVFEDGVFAAGDVFLSQETAGTITTQPGTAGVYIGHMRSTGELLTRMGGGSSFVNHIHLMRDLVGDPADSAPSDPSLGDPQTLTTPDDSIRGWLPATSTYFPGYTVGDQIPTDAVFGYNIQHPDEDELRAVFPVIPEDNAQFSQNGVILESDLVVINRYGIWWMDDSYGNAPWPVDYVAGGDVADDVRLWTTRLIASSTMYDIILSRVVADLADGEASDFAVTSIVSDTPDSLDVSGTEGGAVTGWRGQVTLRNRGITSLRYGRGLSVTATNGDNTSGFTGDATIRANIGLEAKHQWTELAAVGDKMALVTTNGVTSGSPIDLRGHRLGGDPDDFIDFIITGGDDLLPGVTYNPVVTLHAAVDTISGSPTTKNVTLEFYNLSVGSPLGTSRLLRSVEVPFFEGQPGRLQAAVLGTYADVFLEQNEHILVRVKNSDGGSPLTADTLRLVSVYYRLEI